MKARGHVQCGVTQGVPGFSNPDDKGNWIGFDVDICRAVAAAALGNADAVKYTPLSNTERFTALQSGEVDILSRTTTRTLNRDTALGLNFAPVVFYDGQGFMVRETSGLKSAMELNGAAVCVSAGSTTELNLADYFKANGMTYSPVRFEKADEVLAAYDAGRCDVYTSDLSGLAARRLVMQNPAEHVMIGVAVFNGALMAEVVRGGLQAIPKGQYEAATAQGMGYWRMMGFIILPQALRLVIPGLVNTYVAIIKDATLVLIIGLFDLLGIVQAGVADANWLSASVTKTGYVFAGLGFWILCFGLSRWSMRLERQLGARAGR
ncbi:ABC transporter substrate-binding protein/permease [Paracoccaceae bacterium Fryx2]|nr:ABC transporter substrate-binding protein/permease [Paracoccaceae bacterium Fryx2]